MTVNDLKNTYQYAMHGNGAYKGLRQTNTLNAMEYWYKKGVRIFEIDMARTTDNEYVAVAHYLNKKDLNRIEIFDISEQCTLDWFMRQKLFSISTGGLNPLSLKTIIEQLRVHNDMIVMLDLFGMFTQEEATHFSKVLRSYIGCDLSLWNRILIESYNKAMSDGIQLAYSEANVIACVRYEENEHDRTTVSPQELLSRNIRFISYPWIYTADHPGELEAFSKSGITVFSRTKDNTLEKTLRAAGVHVNILAQRYDGARILYQYPLYLLTYLKRIAVKCYIKMKY